MKIKIKRVYDEPEKSDGFRVLVDRVWPRGFSKEKAHVDLWLKEIGPSTELRKWFNHDPEKWTEFKKRYKKELDKNKDVFTSLLDEVKKGDVTLVYSAKDETHNQAVVILEKLKNKTA